MTRATVLLTALLALGTSGCDQIDDLNNDDRTDMERLVGEGAWTAASANVRVDGIPVGIPVANLAAEGDEQTFTFRENGSFTFVFSPADGRRVTISYQGTTYADFPLNQTVTLSGTYTVDEDADEITFSTVASQTADDFEMGYSFAGFTGANLELIAEDPETLARLFGLADADAAQIADVVTGGSITYTQGD
jgi:hypothetical protein